MSERYAIYFAPPAGHPVRDRAAAWLGRDTAASTPVPRSALPGISAKTQATITAEAAKYGFHATLRAPFRLYDACTVDDLTAAARTLAAEQKPFAAALQVAPLGGFIALQPADAAAALKLGDLAAECVHAFEPLRAPLNEAELARRRRAPLSPRQENYLQAWGYPYVFDDFRFHMTLTNRLDPARLDTVLTSLTAYFSDALAAPLTVDAVSLFRQPAADAPFIEFDRVPFGDRSL